MHDKPKVYSLSLKTRIASTVSGRLGTAGAILLSVLSLGKRDKIPSTHGHEHGKLPRNLPPEHSDTTSRT